MAEHAWRLGVDVGQKVFERSSNLFRVGPPEADLDLIGSHRLNGSRQVQERSKDAEGILGLIVGLIETTDEKLLGVACSDLEGVDEESSILAKKRASLARGSR